MNRAFQRLIFSLACLFLIGVVNADPVTALLNIPPPGNYKFGGSTLDTDDWKALIFTTPSTMRAEVVSIEIALSCNPGCSGPGNENYPDTADLQITIYSVINVAGVPTPDVELYSIPIQYGLTLTGRGTQFTFSIPNWQLAQNSTYALVLKSTNTNPTKWSNIELAGNNKPPEVQNGFTFVAASTTDTLAPGNPWITTAADNNAVNMQVILISPVPTLSKFGEIMLATSLIFTMIWYSRTRTYS